MPFVCDKCKARFPEILVDGYPVGDRLLEGVMFRVTIENQKAKVLGVVDEAKPYMEGLNEAKWITEVQEFVEANKDDVIAGCPVCKWDIIPSEDWEEE